MILYDILTYDILKYCRRRSFIQAQRWPKHLGATQRDPTPEVRLNKCIKCIDLIADCYFNVGRVCGSGKATAIWSFRHCKPAACILGLPGANMRLSLICGFP